MLQGRKKFTLFHISLIPISQPTFTTPDQSREDYLRQSLEQPFEFNDKSGRRLYWTPRLDFISAIVGIIQQEKDHKHHMPPSSGGVETVSPEWQGAYVVIDPTSHDDGQKMAVENDIVGRPATLVRSLLQHLNDNYDRPFTIEASLIFDSRSFWQFASQKGGKLKSVRFEFIVPNMWGTKSDLDADLKETGATTGAERVSVAFASSSGLHTDATKIREGVEYAERGAGVVRATALDGETYSSSTKPKTTMIADPEVILAQNVAVDEQRNLTDRILGRG